MTPPPVSNATPHGRSVGLPHSSPLTKLAILPKNSPSGAPITARSAIVTKEIRRHRQATYPPTSAPTSPPWNDMPPSVNMNTCSGCAR